MSGAFRGDAAVKAALLARLERHAAEGSLRFGATQWDEQGGSPLGVSTKGGSSADYAEQFGYPIALAGLLDPLTGWASEYDRADVALHWVRDVAVGADLLFVPERIAAHFLIAMEADRLATPFYDDLRSLYRAEDEDAPPARRTWSALRERMEQAAEGEAPSSDVRAALKACATACWPLRTSTSVLTTLIAAWIQDVNRTPDPEYGEEERASALAMLGEIFSETEPLREAGEPVDIPALFRARSPEMAWAFEAQLARANDRHTVRARSVPAIVLWHLAATTL
ncbi:hypothetical protein ASE67_03245 [Sphingomonas sp. Leaf23]|uniref:hypothetical protein n=1 Tax=Sphingomonas sp. Leaf23 TaxID=1735689 RepID=UPI0006F6A72A|nr:hypothetical protein [Sphingomonas sp. Leaf23]KQM88755.1 hypothetical protein ASE67_03245 [Sphingomonas sp. Leaf23]